MSRRCHYSEREICGIVGLVASEHLNNMTNTGPDIGSDGLCTVGAAPASQRTGTSPS
ncbi:MAG TPA: hypothetical protein VMH35_19830 [Streptosporangiaceae bacterium]|nr:hypothetical protein [Streptosporangiaceae bacterium]